MKKTAVAILLFAAAVSATTAEARKTTPETIYRKGWIDFNKNGRMDPYEDPSRNLDERVEDLLGHMTLEEKSCQLATLYGYGRVLRDSLPTAEWKNEVWKDGIANIDEMLNGVGKSLRIWSPTTRATSRRRTRSSAGSSSRPGWVSPQSSPTRASTD